jgi:hypothetical protein
MKHVVTALFAVTLAACAKPAGTEPAPLLEGGAPTSQPTKVSHEGGHEEHGAGRGDREHVDNDGVVRRGKPLSPDLEQLTVSVASTKAKDLDGKTVKVSGTVESVCVPQGCWFVVQGDTPDQKIRITSKGHDIFVPKSSVGLKAVVEGELKVKTLDQKTAQHYEDERELKPGEQRKQFSGDVQELSLSVVALEMKKG